MNSAKPKDFDEKIITFYKHVIELRKNTSYLLTQIGNTDQTSLYSDLPTNTIIIDKGERA
jgi:hypothetical protein